MWIWHFFKRLLIHVLSKTIERALHLQTTNFDCVTTTNTFAKNFVKSIFSYAIIIKSMIFLHCVFVFRLIPIWKLFYHHDTVWKFQRFSVTQILREIKFVILEFLKMPFFAILENFDFFWSISALKKCIIHKN